MQTNEAPEFKTGDASPLNWPPRRKDGSIQTIPEYRESLKRDWGKVGTDHD